MQGDERSGAGRIRKRTEKGEFYAESRTPYTKPRNGERNTAPLKIQQIASAQEARKDTGKGKKTAGASKAADRTPRRPTNTEFQIETVVNPCCSQDCWRTSKYSSSGTGQPQAHQRSSSTVGSNATSLQHSEPTRAISPIATAPFGLWTTAGLRC
ncbi:hypothetical protein OH77DRAFT_154680 [Trametes cingulata]|nr:hypothetical protein OH77DRAFT_154680 [Trametes cingulata]